MMIPFLKYKDSIVHVHRTYSTISEKYYISNILISKLFVIVLKAKQIIKILYMLLSISMENIFALNSIIDYSNNVKSNK